MFLASRVHAPIGAFYAQTKKNRILNPEYFDSAAFFVHVCQSFVQTWVSENAKDGPELSNSPHNHHVKTIIQVPSILMSSECMRIHFLSLELGRCQVA